MLGDPAGDLVVGDQRARRRLPGAEQAVDPAGVHRRDRRVDRQLLGGAPARSSAAATRTSHARGSAASGAASRRRSSSPYFRIICACARQALELGLSLGGKSLATPFTSILCGVEGNPASTEAARQAIALAGTGTDLQFTAVYTSFELGPDYHKDALQNSLEEAAKLAGAAGVSASYELREAKYAIDVLLPESQEHDLLVLGTHGNSRASGILFGSTASEAAHGAERPLLIARESPGQSPSPATPRRQRRLARVLGAGSRGRRPRRDLRRECRRRPRHRWQARPRPAHARRPARRDRRDHRPRAGARQARRSRDQGDRRVRQAEGLLADRRGRRRLKGSNPGQRQRAPRRQRRVLAAADPRRRRGLAPRPRWETAPGRKKGPVRGPFVSEGRATSEVCSPGSSVLRIYKHCGG